MGKSTTNEKHPLASRVSYKDDLIVKLQDELETIFTDRTREKMFRLPIYAIKELVESVQAKIAEAKSMTIHNSSLDDALNSDDGTYKP